MQEVEANYVAKLHQAQTELASTQAEMVRMTQHALQAPADQPATGATQKLPPTSTECIESHSSLIHPF